MDTHYILRIETDRPDLYDDGPRLNVFHTKEEAMEDGLRWISFYFLDDPTAPVMRDWHFARGYYYGRTGRVAVITNV